MDLTLPQDLSDVDAAVATLAAQGSKDALAAYARTRCGWKGDDARTPKSDIARAIIEHAKANGDTYAKRVRELEAEGMTTSDAQAAADAELRPRTINARFPSKCAKCSGAIQKGERIAYVKASKSAYHVACFDTAVHGQSTREQDAPERDAASEQPQRKQPASDPAAMIYEALRQILATMPAALDEQRVRELSEDAAQRAVLDSEARLRGALEAAVKAVATQLPTQHSKLVISPAGEVTLDEHTHPVFDKVLKIAATGQPVLLKGPAGCGKSHLAAQLAKALKLAYGALHCSAGASESQLLGWLLPTGEGGRFEYVAAQFARMFAEGKALFLIDEIDAADPNFLMVLNGGLANGHLHVPQNWKCPTVERGAQFIVIAAANTYGTGADALYVGRNQLDAATLDRFYVVEMDYDRALESQLAPKDVCEWAWNLRERTAAAKLRRVVSTRTIQRMATALRAGFSMEEARKDALLGWTRDELAKVGQ